jgi:anhydro-N-acetylmuramic acid kinase
MSGTSLDGLDIAHVCFDFSRDNTIDFQLLNHKTFALTPFLFEQLSKCNTLSAPAIFELDQQIARFYAQCVEEFLTEFGIDKTQICAIASHGQTIFHRPDLGYTTQIGCGTTLNYHTQIPVIDQFRQLDVSAGGQGAPLVPLGDQLLFSSFADGFLNLGGFANISTSIDGSTQAFDIAPANLPMNRWMNTIGQSYDQNGEIARNGTVNQTVRDQVLELAFFKQNGPKSLGTEWLDTYYMPLFEALPLAQKLRTHLEVLSTLCVQEFNRLALKRIYLTGGGAFNTFFIELLQSAFEGKLILPDENIINYKEAIIFAFLGARFLRNEPTTISSVTGAAQALRTGTLHDFQGLLR